MELFAFKQAGGLFSIFAGDPDTLKRESPPLVPIAGITPERSASSDRSRASRSSGAASRDESRPAIQEALAALHQYHRWTRMLPAGAGLDRILEHTGYLALAATTPGGVEAGDILHAVDRVRQVFEDGGSLSDAADALEADSEFTSEVESLPLEPGRTDVVRLMNLHKAKGLEAAVVFLADPCGGFNPRVDVHIERDGSQALGWFKVGRKYTRKDGSPGFALLGTPRDWPHHEDAELPFLEAEVTRLLYVAATRAREILVISRHSSQKGTPAWGVLNGYLGAAPELPVAVSVQVPALAPALCSIEAQTDANAARIAAADAAGRPSWSITSVTAEAKHIAKMATAAAPAPDDDATRVVAQDSSSHRADAGMAWGTLIHGLLEHAMRHKGTTREDLRRLGMWLTVEEPQLRAVIDQALDTVERAAKGEFWLVASERAHSVETPFTTGESRHLTNGVIDLLFDSDAGWRVVDYKTDVELDGRQYEVQLKAYRDALRRIGCAIVDASVVNVRSAR